MLNMPENMASANKASVEAARTFADTTLASTEHLTALNMSFARSFMADGIANAKALLGAKDLQQLITMQSTLAQPTVEKFVSYSWDMYEIAIQTQADVSNIVEAQFAEVKKYTTEALDELAKNAPAGSDAAIAVVRSAVATANSAYETISKAQKQVAELAQANLAAATRSTVKPASTANKIRKAAYA